MIGHRWTESEKEFIRQNCDKLLDSQIASVLSKLTGEHITQKSVQLIRRSLGIFKAQGRGYCVVVPTDTKAH